MSRACEECGGPFEPSGGERLCPLCASDDAGARAIGLAFAEVEREVLRPRSGRQRAVVRELERERRRAWWAAVALLALGLAAAGAWVLG